MTIADILSGSPKVFSLIAFFISVLLMFWGMRYFASTKLDDVAMMLEFTVPGIWMMGFSIYLWVIGDEDKD